MFSGSGIRANAASDLGTDPFAVKDAWEAYRGERLRVQGVAAARSADGAAEWLRGRASDYEGKNARHGHGKHRKKKDDAPVKPPPPSARHRPARMVCMVRLALEEEMTFEHAAGLWRLLAFAPTPLALYRALSFRNVVRGEDVAHLQMS